MEKFLHYFKITTLVLPFVLVPFTIILLIAQESIPGNPFYPIKTGLESVILAAASVNPYTKALFTTSLADTRYTEAEKLLLAKGNTSGLHDFVTQVDEAQQNIAKVSNPQQKQALTQQLVTQIDTYQTKLQQDQQQAIASAMTQPSYTQTQNNTTNTNQQQPPPQVQNPNNPIQSNNVAPVQQNQQVAPPPPPVQQTIIIMNISQTQQQLSQIKQNLNQPDQSSPPVSFTPTPTPTLTPTPQPIINVVTTTVPVKVKGNGNDNQGGNDQGNNGNGQGNGNSGKKN